MLLHHQSSLPAFPVASLDRTLSLLIEYCTPLTTEEGITQLCNAVSTFKLPHNGPRLQQLLVEHAKTRVNWLEPFWYDMYLGAREPLPINYNYTFLLEPRPSDNNDQITCAARIVSACWAFMKTVPELTPPDKERSTVLCMDQYQRLFGCCRVPRRTRDVLRVNSSSSHIIVLRKGRIYRLDISGGEADVARGLQAIVDHAKDGDLLPLGYLTAGGREEWAIAYEEIVAMSHDNAAAMDVITSAQFALALDDDERGGAESALHGNGSGNRWYDTCVTVVVSGDAKAALTMEHAWGDGHTVVRLCAAIHASRVPVVAAVGTTTTQPSFSEIRVTLPDNVKTSILPASKLTFTTLAARTVLRVVNFTGFGAQLIQKQAKVSPDAFMQLAFQVASFRTYGKLKSTYESSMVKKFRHGRTEAMRSVTSEALAFCKALPLINVALFRAACAAHGKRLEQCKVGDGIQRHLMGLKKMNNDVSLFPDVAVVGDLLTDSLSTSCVVAPGVEYFAFGAVVENGLGVGYTRTNTAIRVVVTGWVENESDVDAFVGHLNRAFPELMAAVMGAAKL